VFNSIYPAGVTAYTPQINKKTYKVTANEQPLKSNYEEESSNQQSNSSDQKLNTNAGLQKVNIKQILIDFENTLKAIGAKEDVEEEVKGYLGLVEKQAEKEQPSKKIIVGNLRNASEILDGYISTALGKNSTVVKDWISALLLQPIEYKIDKTLTAGFIETVHPEISTKRLIKEEIQDNFQPQIQETQKTTALTIQEVNPDPVQKAIEEAKELVDAGKIKKALVVYAKTFTYAKKIENLDGQAFILRDVASIQDKQNEVEAALKCFNNASKIASKTNNTEIRAQAHAGMGKIYDEFGNYDSAMTHYFSALAFDGENENLKSQAKILNNIGNMQKSRFENTDALEYYKLAFGLAKQVPDIAGMGTSLSNTAKVYKDTGDSVKAIKYYKNSIILDNKAGKTIDVAQSYEQAGDIMHSMGKTLKAVDLYKKSLKKAQNCENSEDFITRITSKLDNIEFKELTA
jgi:tetratricopeptide (TPR) repeat protein